jgi:hypothetical protein
MNTAINEAVKAIVLNAIPKSVTLNYVEYDDKLSEDQLVLVNDVLNMKLKYESFVDGIYDDINPWLMDCSSDAIRMYQSEIKSALESQQDLEITPEDAISENEDLIRDTLYSRDSSTPVKDLIRNTRAQPLRVEMHTNWEGLDSGYNLWRYGVAYDEYFKHIIDVLNLNPAKLKKVLLAHNLECTGAWPNRKARDGKEYVSYEALVSEMENTTSNCNRLTFVGLFNVSGLEDYKGKITFPAGNCVGFFDSWNGAGSMIEMELLRPLTINFNKAQYGQTEYDSFNAYLDNTKSYSIDSVYGVTSKFWGNQVATA